MADDSDDKKGEEPSQKLKDEMALDDAKLEEYRAKQAKKIKKLQLKQAKIETAKAAQGAGRLSALRSSIFHPFANREAREQQTTAVLDKLESPLKRLEYEQRLRELRKSKQFIDTDAISRGAKKYGLLLLIIFLLFLPVGIFLFVNSANHTGPFSYQMQSYYGPFFSQIGSFISPLASLVSNELACVSNPVNCVGTHNTNKTVQVYNTFTSFISASPSEQYQTIFLTGSGKPYTTQAQLFYTVQDTADVPLGTDTSNNILLSESCGSSSNPAATINCLGTTPQSTAPQKNLQFIPMIFQQQTVENQTPIAVQCPWNPNVQLNAISSLRLNFTIENYSAATIFPILFEDNLFYQQLESSQQSVSANQPSVSFVSPGPVQVTLSTSEPQPIVTNNGNTIITVAVSQLTGAEGAFHINQLSIFIPKSLWGSLQSSSGWACGNAVGGRHQQFVLPSGAGYWQCNSTLGDAIQQGGAQFTLPSLNNLGGLHFDTLPILAYINYNYNQSMDMPFIVRAGGGVSC
ncbi:MAG: hypothetical protein M1348_00455 [Candidatus Parvarchaeota archaeon]|nr:hypothetical protein [Candidatus Parvarchaeota archaeon]